MFQYVEGIYDTYWLLPAQSINIIECKEFRNLLLLLCMDLQDKDIPHRTKICEAIIKAWETWFQRLKQELVVCSIV